MLKLLNMDTCGFTGIQIRCADQRSCYMTLNCNAYPYSVDLAYFKCEDCVIVHNFDSKKHRTMHNRGLADAIFDDLNEVFSKQDSSLYMLSFTYKKWSGWITGRRGQEIIDEHMVEDEFLLAFFKNLESALKMRSQRLKIANIEIDCRDVKMVESFLACIDASALDRLQLNVENTENVELYDIAGMRSLMRCENMQDFFRNSNFKERDYYYELVNEEDLNRVLKRPVFNCIYAITAQQFRIPMSARGFLKEICSMLFKSIWFSRRLSIASKSRSDELVNKASQVLQNTVIMDKLLENCSCIDVLRLRKVSAGIRDCILNVKKDPNLDTIMLTWRNTNVLIIDVHHPHGLQQIFYVNGGDGCFAGKRFVDDDCSTAFKRDFEINLKYQANCLEELRFDLSYHWYFRYRKYDVCSEDYDFETLDQNTAQFLDAVQELLKSRETLLKVKKLSMEISNGRELSQILPYIHPKSLEIIELINQYEYYNRVVEPLEIGEICRLEQWKCAKILKVQNHVLGTNVQEMNLFSFDEGKIVVTTISTEDIVFLKENFLELSSLKKFQVSLQSSTVDNDLLQNLMGIPYRWTETTGIWFYPFQNTGKFLHVMYNKNQRITFSCIDSDTVPEDFLLYC